MDYSSCLTNCSLLVAASASSMYWMALSFSLRVAIFCA